MLEPRRSIALQTFLATFFCVVLLPGIALMAAGRIQYQLCSEPDLVRRVATTASAAVNPSATPLVYFALLLVYIAGAVIGAWRFAATVVGLALATACIGGLLGAITVTKVKQWATQPRPDLPCAPAEAVGYGMPSGHAQTAGALFGCALVLVYSLRASATAKMLTAALLALLAGIIPVARVAVGAHSIGQVLLGFAFGVILSAGSAALAWAICGAKPTKRYRPVKEDCRAPQ